MLDQVAVRLIFEPKPLAQIYIANATSDLGL